ncbi:MAG: hypothetical protein H7Y01_09305 [Ferruginibacter sp.]|nr:hypothetical protein [Chitinophagaceae bacterium]
MLFSTLIIFFIVIVLVIMLVRFLVREKSIPGKLFTEALRNENSGDFEAAIVNYETALTEVTKSRLKNNSLKLRITERLKTLYTVIECNKNFHVGRYDVPDHPFKQNKLFS